MSIDSLNISSESFGQLPDGSDITQFTLSNIKGISVKILDFGGIITEINTPDKSDNFENIVLAYDNPTLYWLDETMMGALVGPYCNRISNATFEVEDTVYTLDKNFLGKHNIHAGSAGVHDKIWQSKTELAADFASVTLTYACPNGLGGYPGNIDLSVIYSLDNHNRLSVKYFAKTDKSTPLNLTQHSYFNLNGVNNNNILDHILKVEAETTLEVDEEQIPTGRLLNVKNNPFDFSKPKQIGKDISANNNQLKIGNGYDVCYVLKNRCSNINTISSTLYAPNTGRVLNVYTDRPCLQIYTSNSLENPFSDGGASKFKKYDAVCLETEGYINAINQNSFPTDILTPTQAFESTTIFEFKVK